MLRLNDIGSYGGTVKAKDRDRILPMQHEDQLLVNIILLDTSFDGREMDSEANWQSWRQMAIEKPRGRKKLPNYRQHKTANRIRHKNRKYLQKLLE